jgi:hypothetical protein|tara:strand:- start:326 stop:460 length:135 start_codon:yes stop_codon:yes gene_type:complete
LGQLQYRLAIPAALVIMELHLDLVDLGALVAVKLAIESVVEHIL